MIDRKSATLVVHSLNPGKTVGADLSNAPLSTINVKKSFTLAWIYSSAFYREVTLDHFWGVVKLEIYAID